jgi:hypothetical protein
MQITIRIDRIYGIETVYPVCKQAILFSRIAGHKTLTRATLQHIADLGYDFVIAPPVVKDFKHIALA